MKNSQSITFDELMTIVSWGLFTKTVKKNQINWKGLGALPNIKGAEYNGKYIGSPGRDIFLMLPFLSQSQMEEVAKRLCEHFPIKAPSHNVQYSACIRFIYGQNEKQGSLRSEEDFLRMKKNGLDWSLPRKFINILKNFMEQEKKYYGLTIVHEIGGHRYGDEAIIYNKNSYLVLMKESYEKAMKYALLSKSYKHLFSIYYWASRYYIKMKKTEKAASCSKKSLMAAGKYYHKYFPNGEPYYSSRLRFNLNLLKNTMDNEKFKNFNNLLKEKIKSSHLKLSLFKH